MRKKIIALCALAALVTAVLPGSVASANKAPSKPGKGSPTTPQPTAAEHTGGIAGTINYVDDVTTDVLGGTINLEVDQISDGNAPIVFASLSLPSGFTWSEDVDVTVTSDELGGGEVSGWTATTSGNTISISGLNLTDSDTDLVDGAEVSNLIEFTISIEDTAITTTQETSGLYGVSSQYRTNPDRRNKTQTWVLSTPGLINLEVTQAYSITWDSVDGSTVVDGPDTYTTESSIGSLPTPPTKDGYTFENWYTQPLGAGTLVTGAYTPTTPYGAVTFYANWTSVAPSGE